MTSPFVGGTSLRIAGAAHGALAGLTFAVKDLFDVAGYPTGGGNPDWARQNPVPTRHAFALFVDAQGIILGADNPIGTAGSSFAGFAGGGGIEWARGLSFALAGRYHHLAGGPKMITASLVIGLGAP